jgi:hypothetical protein
MKICGSKAGTKTELPDRNSIGRLQRFSKHAKVRANGIGLLALRLRPVDNSTRCGRHAAHPDLWIGLTLPATEQPDQHRTIEALELSRPRAFRACCCRPRLPRSPRSATKMRRSIREPMAPASCSALLVNAINRQRGGSSCLRDYCFRAIAPVRLRSRWLGSIRAALRLSPAQAFHTRPRSTRNDAPRSFHCS